MNYHTSHFSHNYMVGRCASSCAMFQYYALNHIEPYNTRLRIVSLIASRAHDSVPAVVLNREITTAQWQTRRVTVFRSAKLARLLPVATQVFLCKFTKRVVAVAVARRALTPPVSRVARD